MIAMVWVSSVLISCPPVFGWGDKNREPNTCTLNLLLSYRIYSSMGSFYVPCFIMVFVYLRIFKVIHDREKYLMKSSSSNTTTFSMPHLNSTSKRVTTPDDSNSSTNDSNALIACICCCLSPLLKWSSASTGRNQEVEKSLSSIERSSQVRASQSMVCFNSNSINNKNGILLPPKEALAMIKLNNVSKDSSSKPNNEP